jgi:hypothetical protein
MYFNRILTQISSHLYKTQAGVEAHQGVMTDRRHDSLKRGDRLTKKERQTTASELGKSDKLRFVVYVKSDSDIYYNKTSDKAATK